MELLETTLRDGSYTVNFQFTAQDTYEISKALDQAGFKFIEIGHGVGLGAFNKGQGEAAETDEDYMKAAAEAVTHGKFGMFCIPGIADLDAVDMCVDYGMGFLRVGTNVNDVELGRSFIEKAKKHGMFVAANFMKSYASSPEEFAEKAVMAQKYGADTVYIVDSCGGMLPDEIEKYFRAVRDVCDISLSFHGHNNLELGVANSLHALELGADIIDTSLQGLGRSAGNVPTEIMLPVLERAGYDVKIDAIHVMDIAERFIRPLIRKIGYSSLDIVAGWAQFHSGYMKVIQKHAGHSNIDPRRLIIEICKRNKVDISDELAEEVVSQIHQKSYLPMSQFSFDTYFGREEENHK